MKTIAGCTLDEQLHDGTETLVYRARQVTGKPVILKLLKPECATPSRVARFKLEYDISSSLDAEAVPSPLGLESDQGCWAIVSEDTGAQSLERLVRQRSFSLAELLHVAVQLADALGRIHQRYVIHRDIKPSNVVLEPHHDRVRLIDFGSATLLSQETPALGDPDAIEGTLAYVSPEQTGRMNRKVDHRTDLYSLGVTLYELFSGQLPFTSTEPLELVHAHLARAPTPLHALRPDIPPMFSSIVLRLMAKNAEERYQSAHGVRVDLEECLRQMRERGRIEAFELGRADVSDQLRLSQKLYGREWEMRVLLEALERSTQGVELVLISGEAGIGKSALVMELYRPLTRQRGYFIAGKFDQLQRDIPYAPFIQAFRELLHQLLARSEVEISMWRQRLLEALGTNGPVIASILPELELILGPQPESPALTPIEAQNRFQLTFRRFTHVFARPEHPLVIFLDDLQWVDTASLQLLKALLTGKEQGGLLLLGAYREGELGSSPRLKLALDELREAGLASKPLSLSALSLPQLGQFLTDSFRCEPSRVERLAQVVWSKAHGNPFFVNELLKAMHARGLLRFEHSKGQWEWELGVLQDWDVTDNVAKLMSETVQRLSPETRRVLRLAACIGNRFDLRDLAVISERPFRLTADAIWEAVREGLLLPRGEAYRLARQDVSGLEETGPVELRFAHDQVQNACYVLIPDEERQMVHRAIGRLLLEKTLPEAREERIFDITYHLNLGRALMPGEAERLELLALNLSAGRKARASAAYEPAFRHFQVALELLAGIGEEQCWREHYPLTLDLHVDAAEAAYLSGAPERMEELVEAVSRRARVDLDRARATHVRMQALIVQNRYPEAVRLVMPLLALLGVSLPSKPTRLQVMKAFLQTRLALAGRSPESLARLPEMTDPSKLMAMRLLNGINAVVYLIEPELFALLVCTQICLCLRHGSTPELSDAFSLYGIILVGALGQIESAAAYAKLALALLERFGARRQRARVFMSAYAFVLPWKLHMSEVVEQVHEGFLSGLEQGDFEFAGYLANTKPIFSFFLGTGLSEVDRLMVGCIEAFQLIGQKRETSIPAMYRQAVQNLAGGSSATHRLMGEHYDEERMFALHQEAREVNAHHFLLKLMLCYLFRQYRAGLEVMERARPYTHAFSGLVLLGWYVFYEALHLLSSLPETPEAERRVLLRRVAANQKQLKKWARHGPKNFQNKFSLVEAERCRAAGRHEAAAKLYAQAIALSRQHGFVIEEALSQELAGGFHLERGNHEEANRLLRDAHFTYTSWGALAKAQELEACHPQVFVRANPLLLTPSSTSDARSNRVLDLTSVIKASQAISHEIVLESLLKRMMKVLVENAGARKGILVLQGDKGQLISQAQYTLDSDEVTVLQGSSLQDEQNLSPAIVSYVWRVGEMLVLNDATAEGAFVSDAYVMQRRPKSILCIPIRKQQKRVGVLYLENDLVASAFSRERIDLLELLAAQAAISLENARLYETLEHRVAERTKELHEGNTQLARLLQRLQETQRQVVEKERLASLGALTATVAHEIKNPLNFINNFSELMQGLSSELESRMAQYSRAPTPELREELSDMTEDIRLMVSKIHEHGKRVDRIVSSMYQNAASRRAVKQSVNLAVLLSEHMTIAYEGVRAREPSWVVELVKEFDDTLGSAMVAPDEVGRVIINLVTNACQAAVSRQREQSGGAPWVKVSAKNLGPRVEVRVRDNGMGIPNNVRDKIFTPFFTTRPATEGLGLGLSISRDIVVQLHGGTLIFESEEGRGTEFILMLPRGE